MERKTEAVPPLLKTEKAHVRGKLLPFVFAHQALDNFSANETAGSACLTSNNRTSAVGDLHFASAYGSQTAKSDGKAAVGDLHFASAWTAMSDL